MCMWLLGCSVYVCHCLTTRYVHVCICHAKHHVSCTYTRNQQLGSTGPSQQRPPQSPPRDTPEQSGSGLTRGRPKQRTQQRPRQGGSDPPFEGIGQSLQPQGYQMGQLNAAAMNPEPFGTGIAPPVTNQVGRNEFSITAVSTHCQPQ